MNVFLIILMVIGNFVFQSTILPSLAIFGVVPNTALIFVILFSLNKGKYYGGFVGMAIGFIQDIMFSTTMGVNAFIYFFIGYIIGTLENTVSRDSIIPPVIFSILGTIFYNFIYFFFMFFLSRRVHFFVHMKDVMIIEIIYNTIATLIIYKIIGKIFVEPSLKFGKR